MDNLSNPAVIRNLLERHGFSFSKALGQNFLINPAICPKMAQQGIDSSDWGVLEIGAGVGVLTQELARRASKVAVVEIDERLLPVLEESLAEHQNVSIVLGDVMKVDLPALLKEQFGDRPVCVCANLPYYITSPILMMLLEQRLPLKAITVMVQKEAAARLCAQPGSRECGAVTFAVRYYSTPRQLFPVSRGSFFPAPKVDSAVIRLDVHPNPDHGVTDEKLLFSIVRAGFGQRRKTLANPLSAALHLPKEKVQQALEQAELPLTVRAEAVPFDGWIKLANALKEQLP
ncbi:MAG TPA: ribosomal RNA small subunit methyltransferase A [Candidatus Egerieicola faecale]|uniref:Ribosomal RNA small subunit methyltransferase A n=1 Tax=Candidatus Egerieicola faecale TaxID=2840774 RepID=A0A9D1LJ11_9FIRM|nr:ribosomal RNA small subunit methyltransferase A [Candidatus Egerieicola faecale]